MAKRSDTEKSYKVKVVDKQVKPKKVSVKKSFRVTLRLVYPVRYIYRSSKTGEKYIWERAGSEVPVHLDDSSDLQAKFRKGGCCGASPQKHFIFEEVK